MAWFWYSSAILCAVVGIVQIVHGAPWGAKTYTAVWFFGSLILARLNEP